MSKSLKRVRAALLDLEMADTILETGQATTAQMAADEIGCDVNQIVKSIIFLGETSGACILFLTAGGNQVDPAKAANLANEPLDKADATIIRRQTGFAIGGVSPIGHLTPLLRDTYYCSTRMKQGKSELSRMRVLKTGA